MKFVLGMKDGDPGRILDTIFGAINVFEDQTADTDVFDFTDFGKIDSEGSVGIFFNQETCVFTPFRSHCIFTLFLKRCLMRAKLHCIRARLSFAHCDFRFGILL
jgi:hypothetical protein